MVRKINKNQTKKIPEKNKNKYKKIRYKKLTRRKIKKFKKEKKAKVSGFNNFKFGQHNIGSIPYNFTNVLYDNSGYFTPTNVVKNKKFIGDDNIRNVKNYIYTNQFYFEYEMFTFQEVQLGDKPLTITSDKFNSFYNPTGSLSYCNIDPNDNTEKQINVENGFHGCVVSYNKEMFDLLEKRELKLIRGKYRYSPILILRENKTGNVYGVLSVHGIICNPIKNKYNDFHEFYSNIIDMLFQLNNDYKGKIQFIVGGDFNIDLTKPDFNPFNDPIAEQELKYYEIYYQRTLNEFKKLLTLLGINIISVNKPTNKDINSPNFEKKLDFILTNNYGELLKSDIEYYKGKKKNLGKVDFLEKDFDHSMICMNIDN